jgi:hypothetical protein
MKPSTTKDEVSHVAVTIPRAARHDACPAAFNAQGDMHKAWAYLRKDIEQARAAHIAFQDVQRLYSKCVGPAKDQNGQLSVENKQQAHKGSTSSTKKRPKLNSNTEDRMIQAAKMNIINKCGISLPADDCNNHPGFPPSNEFASHLPPIAGEGAIDSPTSFPQYTRLNGMRPGLATGVNTQPTIIVCSDQGSQKESSMPGTSANTVG